MADEQSPDRDIKIQSTVKVSTATNQTSVSGATVKIDSARDAHVHRSTASPPSLRNVSFVGVLAFLGAVLVNIATSQLPESWKPYLWLAWPLALLVTVVSIWVAYHQGRPTSGSVTIPDSVEQRNRRAMLTKVKAIWIDGLLEQSLAKELRIALDLTERPDAVQLPLNALVQELNHPPRTLSASMSIVEVFDQMGGALLILGAPGAGKTTLLLELARDLIVRAEHDEAHPIPVVFNLSSWAAKRQPLKEWLVEELNTKYDVPRKLAQAWMDADVVLPLLDGLDEVAPQYREGCAEAINSYQQNQHGLMPIAVCSREADYEVLTTKLRLQGAVVVQPLTIEKVDVYLERAGKKLEGVLAALYDDAELRELLDNPLMLSIVVLVYKDKPAAKLRAAGMSVDRRRQLFDDYITAIFHRRNKQAEYTRQHTTHYLCWLASQMVKYSQTVFYIDLMQPYCLPRQQQQKYVVWVRLFIGLTGAFIVGLGTGIVGGFVAGLLGGAGGALYGSLYYGSGLGLSEEPGKDANAQNLKRIEAVEALRWSWSQAGFGLLVGLIGGLIIGLASAVPTLIAKRTVEWYAALFFALVLGLISGFIGLFGGLIGGLSVGKIEEKITPNEGIHHSINNMIVVTLAAVLVYGSALGLVGYISTRAASQPAFLLFWILTVGLICGLKYGGTAVLQHYTLRWLLYRNGSLPLRLVPFLDYCVDRIFLHKVGGGYIFIHRLLMEHFASLYTEQSAAPPSDEATD